MTAPHEIQDPSPWLVRWAPLLPAGRPVLDLACGRGRHARYLAARGHPVLAVDRDAEALAALAGVAGVTTAKVDLERGAWPFPGRLFAGVVVTNYLHRPLLGLLAEAVEPGGALVYETFMQGNERFGKPSNPAFLLAPGELATFFGALLTIAAFEQGLTDRPTPAAIQRICAIRGDAVHIRLR